MSIVYFDAHCHWQDEWLSPHLEQIQLLAESLNVQRSVVNGTHPGDWAAVAALAATSPLVLPSYGVHPWWTANLPADWLQQLRQRLIQEPGAAVGEVGLDRWILDMARDRDLLVPRESAAGIEQQKGIFQSQLELAAELERPVTIHCLQAWGALDSVLRNCPRLPACGHLLHAYGGSLEMVNGFVERGAYFSFNTYFMHERKEDARAVFRAIPAERLLVETDAPAMPPPASLIRYPLPLSDEGRVVNHPANIVGAYAALAELRGVSLETLAKTVAVNFARLFGGLVPA
ncbi:MAG: TatD family hydrolase [Verrucomicrobiota bacterium]|nr:TatD family hydrolase [Verrucomicrobiota bacterium]